MSHNDNLGPVWVFDQARLDQALQSYESEALAAYPGQTERIRTTVLAMRDFLNSEHAAILRMRLGAQG
jgi:hypothetical protein